MELLIVLIIIAVVASLAIPQYRNVDLDARIQKARYSLALITQAERIIQTENGAFTQPVASGALNATIGNCAAATCSGIDLSSVEADPDWSYTVAAGIATATYLHAGTCTGNTMTWNMTTNQQGNDASACW